MKIFLALYLMLTVKQGQEFCELTGKEKIWSNENSLLKKYWQISLIITIP